VTDPWFTPEIYAILPGLIVGLSCGTYGVLLGMLVNTKNFKSVFQSMSVVVMIVCLGTIFFGVIATVYDQPEGTFYDFSSTGLIGIIVVGIIYRTVHKLVLSDDVG